MVKNSKAPKMSNALFTFTSKLGNPGQADPTCGTDAPAASEYSLLDRNMPRLSCLLQTQPHLKLNETRGWDRTTAEAGGQPPYGVQTEACETTAESALLPTQGR